jgi:hypothetical protein
MRHRVISSQLVPPDEIRGALHISPYRDTPTGSANVQHIRSKLLRVTHVKRRVAARDGAGVELLTALFGVKVCPVEE